MHLGNLKTDPFTASPHATRKATRLSLEQLHPLQRPTPQLNIPSLTKQTAIMAPDPEATQSAMILTTSICALVTGYMLGMYTTRGYLISPTLAAERRSNYNDPVESDSESIDEDDTLLDHAPNWSNGAEADRRDGLRMRAGAGSEKKQAEVVDDGGNEECKLVLVVRTDLGMTKGFLLYLALAALANGVETRQDSSPVRPRNPRMLQDPHKSRQQESVRRGSTHPGPLGEARPGQDRGAGQVAGRDHGAAGAGARRGRHGRGRA